MKIILFMIYLFSMMWAAPVYSFDVEQVKHEIFIQLSMDLKAGFKKKPVLILIGGYPGAGKTTLIHALVQIYDIDVISWNSIRQALLDRHLKGSPHDWEIIEAVNRNLFRHCLQRNANIAIDANAYANNIQLFENLLDGEQSRDRYRVLKICLNPSVDTLRNRIRAREQKEGVHQGTETDLIRDLNTELKRIYMDDYSLIIKNDDIDFEKELDIVNSYLKSYL